MKSKLSLALTLGALAGHTFGAIAQEAPAITEQPASQSVATGGTANFSVVATGTDPLGYQWYFANGALADQTNSSLAISSVTQTNAGEYFVVVVNDSGSVTSEVATLTIGAPILDLDGDGKTDILWVHSDGRIAGWLMDGTNKLGNIVLSNTAPEGWRMVGQADFDKDGKIDFLWHHRNGRLQAWLMDGTNRLSVVNMKSSTASWRVAALYDFNDDGSADILWQRGDGRTAVWYLNGTEFDSSAVVNNGAKASGGWRVVTVIDFDDDGDGDILWQHASGKLAGWQMNGLEKEAPLLIDGKQGPSSAWDVVAATDVDGDGETDFIWRHPDGRVAVWLMNGVDKLDSLSLNEGDPVGNSWRIVGPK